MFCFTVSTMEGKTNPNFSLDDEQREAQNEQSTIVLDNSVSSAACFRSHSSTTPEILQNEDSTEQSHISPYQGWLKVSEDFKTSAPSTFEVEISETTVPKEKKTQFLKYSCDVSQYRGIVYGVSIGAINVGVIAYVTAAIMHWRSLGKSEMDWCNGLGMLIILTVLTYTLILYYQLKKYLNKTVISKFMELQKLWSKFLTIKYVVLGLYLFPLLVLVVYLSIDITNDSERLQSCFGLAVIMLFGLIFSKHPKQVWWRPVVSGLVIQFVLGLLTIRWSVGRRIFECIGEKAATFLSFSQQGAQFVYGKKIIDDGIFAFRALSVIFFLSFIVQILYYYGVMQWVVINLGWMLQVIMGTTVCESVNAAASIFLGMSESPLLFKPYLKNLTKSEMHAIMTGGFATVAGTVLAAYINFGIKPAHLITASVMSAPAALCYSKLFYPETEESKNKAEDIVIEKSDDTSVLDAATKGALSGIQLVLGIIANIIAFVAFVAFLNALLSWLGMLVGVEQLTFEYLLGKVFIPLAWIMGVEWKECEEVAQLVGLKTIVNEFVAYEKLGEVVRANKLSARSEMIATYALCGFSNPASVGILVGALVTLVPEQRNAVTEVALRAFVAGSATCFLTASIAGILITNENFPVSSLNVTSDKVP